MKNKLKKSLSLIMTVLMVLSCWVWVAPTEAEAADYRDGYYWVEIRTHVSDTANEDGSTITLTYKTNNGMGETKDFVKTYGQMGWDGDSTVFADYIPGYPTGLKWVMTMGNGRSENHRDISVYVGKDAANCNTRILYEQGYKFANPLIGDTTDTCILSIVEGIETPRPTSMMNASDATQYVPTNASTHNLFEVNNKTVNISIPDINNPEALVQKSFTAQPVDQYGVYWYNPAVYALAQTNRSTSDISEEESGFWWTQTADKKGATVNVTSAMQEFFSVREGNTKDYYLVAYISENNGQAIAAKTLSVTYPKYDWAFYGDVSALNDGKVSIFVEDKTTDETKVYAWDGDDQGTEPDSKIVVTDYLAYNQKSSILPMYAEKDGFTFYGFWTVPQTPVAGNKGDPFSSEADFAEPVDSTTYFNLPEAEKELYCDAGEQWNYRTDAVTTNNKIYYAWWLSDDISVKFYDVDGSYIDSFNVKAGHRHTAISGWPEPAEQYQDGYTNGAFTYSTWTGKWVNIDGDVVDPTNYTFTEDLILTPQYEKATFDKTHNVEFYDVNGNFLTAYSKEYNYRDVAAVPTEDEAGQIDPYLVLDDYRYTFEGWSAQTPSTDKKYHVMLEDADYDVNLNAISIAEDFVVRSDATYYPVYRRHAIGYDVTFSFRDESAQSQTITVPYKYGQLIEIPDEIPEAYARYGMEYRISAWTNGRTGPEIVLGEEICTGKTTYYAVYPTTGVAVPYNVTFEYVNSNNEKISTVAPINHGFKIGQDIVNALDVNETYDDGTQQLTFNGTWVCSNGNTYATADLAAVSPTSHLTFTAVYTDGVPFRTVTYVDGEISKEFRITDGTQLPYWTRDIETAEGTVTETYVPSKASTEFGTYEFAGWFDEKQADETATNGTQYKPGETAIGADVTLYPQFIYEPYNYNFVFKNWDGTDLVKGTLHLGDSLSELRNQAEKLAIRDADETYTYQFLGWDKRVPEMCEGGEPDSTLTFIAQYKPVYIYYNVEWFNDKASMDGGEAVPVATSKYVYGAKMHTPSVTLTVPEGAPEGQNYVFAGWYYDDAQGNAQPFVRNMTITGDMKFYATYALTAKMHKVTVNDGTNTYTLTVEDGANIKDLVSDPIAGYVNESTHNGFKGWLLDGAAFDIENATITDDITIVADFEVGQHVYDKSEIVTLPTYPMAGYTDYDGTVVEKTEGKGLKRFWCECNKEKTSTTDADKIAECIIPALKDDVDPGTTAYIGTANWSDFNAAAAADVVYANPNTDFIITTSDKGNVDKDYNATGKGIGVQEIVTMIVEADTEYTEDALSMEIDAEGTVVYDWANIQSLLIKNYGGWNKVPEMYKDYNANFTAKLGSYNLTDGETYVLYARVKDKAGNMSFIRTADFIYDATKPVIEVAGDYNEAENTYCEQAIITVAEATEYVLTVDGTPISAGEDGEYKIGEGVHQVVVTDKAGNKTSVFFTVLKEHTLVNYNEAPDCVTAGFTSQRCLSCGADFNKKDVPELGHDWEDVIVRETCEEHGYISRSCSRCEMPAERQYYQTDAEGNIVKDEDGNDLLLYPATGHKWNDGVVVKAATCKTEGVKNFTCSVCGTTKQEEIAAQDGAHSFYKAQVVKPTCTQAGKVTQLCRICGETVVIAQGSDNTADNYDAEYAPTGHTPDKWIVTEAARCFARGTDAEGKAYFGVETNVCSVCDTVITDENDAAVTRYIYDAIAHTWIVDEANCVEPAVGVEGVIAYKCAVEGCPGTKEPTKVDALVEYSITFIGTTVAKVTDEETGEVTLVEKESKQVDKGLPGETAGKVLNVQEKLDSADGKVAYVFDGWYTKKADGSFDKKYTTPMEIGTENITLYAKFKEKDIFYTVDFEIPSTYTPATETEKEKYGDYTEFKSLMGAIGDERTPGEEPTFAETDYFKFSFDGWYTKGTNPSKYDGKIAGDATYQAAFKAEAKKYTVIFMSDGVVFDTEEVVAGATAVPSEGEPEKASDDEYHYTFKGWYTSTDGRTEADLTDITEKTTVYAVYTAEAHNKGTGYTVKQEANCELPEIREYTCTDCNYVWSEIFGEALGHTAGDPVYNEETGKNEIHCEVCDDLLSEADASYTIKFEDHNGRRLDTITVKVNNKFVEQAKAAAELASKASDDKNNYTFAGWIVKEGDTPVTSENLPAATANVTYIAAYTATARTFSVTFATSTLVTGESVAKKTFSGIAYGKVVDKDGNDVTKYAFDKDVFGIPESDSKVHYVFKGWDADLSKGVTKDTLVRPVYEAVSHSFDNGVPSAADCTQSGGYKYTCSECGYYYISGNIPALGHNYVTKVVKEPTYKEEGLAVKTCQRCGDTIEEKLPVKQYIVVKVTVKDTNGKAYHGAKVEITHDGTGKVYGPNLTDTNGVATFYVEQSGEYFVRVLEIPGHEGGYSGDITVNENGDITSSTLPTLKGEGSQSCTCGCHRSNFWGMLFRFFHNIIKLLAGRYICCDCPDSRY